LSPRGGGDLEIFGAGPAAALAALALFAYPGAGRALEPRFDHRDEVGIVGQVEGTYGAATYGGSSHSGYDFPALSLGISFDVTGEGDELILGGTFSPLTGSDGAVSTFALDGRYRGFFGADEVKTFFDAGLVLPVAPRVAVGPRLGFGVMYDPSRSAGAFASVGAATALGAFRGFTIGLALGFQWRWPG